MVMVHWDATLLLLCSMVYVISVPPPNISAATMPLDHLLLEEGQPLIRLYPDYPTINISFIKEVTLTVQPQDFELSPHQEQEVSSFLESGLRLLDPIMRFFEGFLGPAQRSPPSPAPEDPRFIHIA